MTRTRPLILSLLLLVASTLTTTLAGCRSGDPNPDPGRTIPFVEPEGGNTALPANSTLPELYRREGLISSNSYQVLVQVVAGSEFEARELGRVAGEQRAIELMQNERAISSRIGYYGRQEIRKLVEREGTVVFVHPEETPGSYTVVYQVFKAGLHEYLQKLF